MPKLQATQAPNLGPTTHAGQGLVLLGQRQASSAAGPNLRPTGQVPQTGGVNQYSILTERLARLKILFSLIKPVPDEWLGGSDIRSSSSENRQNALTLKSCESYSELVRAWRKSMKWSEGLDAALAVMLASSMSTQFVGEQLWFKIIGPPSCGKTSLMEGLATAKKWYLSKDTIRGFHSGYHREDGKDVSLAEMARGMTLGTKDGDTLLKAPNLKQILAEGRALYDRVSRTNYRNDVNREYVGHRMTWHLAGTKALREIDDSELGVRFLDVVVMETIDDEFEDEVGWRAANQEARNMLHLSDGKPESQYPEDLALAMAMSGGYLDFLRTNALEISRGINIESYRLDQCNTLGKFVAFMRARPVKDSEHDGDRELSARLVKQLTRLAISLAAVLNKEDIDDEVMALVYKVVMDTSRGFTLEILRVLARMPQGAEIKGLSLLIRQQDDYLRRQLRFMRKIGIVETDLSRKRWRVTPKMSSLYGKVKDL